MNTIKTKNHIIPAISEIKIEDRVKILSEFLFFEKLDASVLRSFAEKVHIRRIQPMEIFVEEGQNSDYAFFIYKGAASIFRTTEAGDIISIDLVGAPDVVGEMGLVAEKPSATSAMAIEETYAFVLSHRDFMQLSHLYPATAVRLIELLADRVSHFDIYIEELLSKNLHDRIWNALQYLAKFFPNREISLSQQELDDIIWGSRARITEALGELEREGKIKVARRKIKIL